VNSAGYQPAKKYSANNQGAVGSLHGSVEGGKYKAPQRGIMYTQEKASNDLATYGSYCRSAMQYLTDLQLSCTSVNFHER